MKRFEELRRCLKDLVTEALEAHLGRPASGEAAKRGWRSVFGQAQLEEVEPVDAVIAGKFENVDLDDWR